jgi:hydrogenase nickel incorporation protein HypB
VAGATIEETNGLGASAAPGHHLHHGHDHHGHHHHHDHDHDHDRDRDRDHDLSGRTNGKAANGTPAVDFGAGAARAHAPGLSQTRMVQIEQDVLAKNNSYAAANRDYFTRHGILALNLVSSPGSGKTALLVKSIEHLRGFVPVAVIEGDQQTANDAERIRATGAPAIQVNTGKGCHLDGHMVGHAVDRLGPADGAILFIENVGNLVCPAGFDLGEEHRVVVLSVTEGEDKPLKYPEMFASADLMLLSKIDLVPHLDVDVDACIANARKINPRIKVLKVSARSGEGLDSWIAWLKAARTLAFPAAANGADNAGAAPGAAGFGV